MITLWIFVFLVIVWRLVVSYTHLSKVPKEVPWATAGRFVPHLITQIRGLWNMPYVMNTAYQKYCKHGSICAIALPFARPEILLPSSLIQWMTSQSGKVLSPTPVQMELVAAEHAFLNSFDQKESVVYDVLRVQMNRRLPALIPGLAEELKASIDNEFGSNAEWKETQLFVVVRRVVAKLITWLVVGDDLSRDHELVENLSQFSLAVMPSAMGIALFPPFMQPIAAHLTCFINRIYMNRALKALGPYIERRIMEVESGFCKGQPQNNVMTWHIEEALRKKEPRELMPQLIASRVFATTMAALEAITLTVTHTLFCVASSNSSAQIWSTLEEEAKPVLSTMPINQDVIDKLHFADAAIKEGLRLQTALKALTVQVMQPSGLIIKDTGVHLPQGARISVSAWGIHHDEDIYPDAYTYDAFRFAPQNGGVSISPGGDGDHLMTTPSEKYLSFGFGKHVCPGRHLAAAVTKLFLAHVAVNYDLEPLKKNPGLLIIGHLPTPPTKAKLKMRRKDGLSFSKEDSTIV
ncbi:hypothetical protein NW752_007554 [Fusarium irregulare]|uniref:Cytochrome P450 n=1 Tax=Fusarium irregulare TaxID=2494466 RepID=A0A9W8PHX9_9HYPO|nr:hypothetical protein NW766_010149 [Fusarium irregulare]KAJ4013259.1 hypothetical protein NW752_007554 [Fusarium irregulare]